VQDQDASQHVTMPKAATNLPATTAPNPKELVATPTPEPTQPALPKLNVVRTLNLDPEDYRWITWSEHQPLPKPERYPGNRSEALAALNKLLAANQEFKEFKELNLSVDQALLLLFFIGFVDRDLYRYSPFNIHIVFGIPEILEKIAETTLWHENKVLQFVEQSLNFNKLLKNKSKNESVHEYILESAINPSEINHLDSKYSLLTGIFPQWQTGCVNWLSERFEVEIFPYLTDSELNSTQEKIHAIFNYPFSCEWQGLLHLAAQLKLYNDIHNYLEKLQDAHQKRIRFGSRTRPSILLRLGSSDTIKAQINRLRLYPTNTLDLRVCLAATEFSALTAIFKGIFYSDSKGSAETLTKILLDCANSPEIAPYLLELATASKLSKLSKASKLAQHWLDGNTDNAIVGLIPVAAGVDALPISLSKNELIEAARKFLRIQVRHGYTPRIQKALEMFSQEIAAKIQTEVLVDPELQIQTLAGEEIPDWLTSGIRELQGGNSPKAITWVTFADLPPLVIGNTSLLPEHIQSCLTALSLSTLESPLRLVRDLKVHVEPRCLDAFIWSLFERWLTEGAPPKEKWAMMALGLLGSDAIALKLTPLIRNWPGENQHPRAVLGLQCLRTIGTDTALMLINGIAQKTKYQGLQARAEECMETIARDRQLTQDQLEDRIIPDCGLDAMGKRIFDYGGRQFQFVLSADLRPAVKDGKGKLITSLPKPNSADDSELAEQANADWKLLKKQISDVVKIQSVRLEDAMIDERRWTWAEFTTLLVQHPLMLHFVQRLVWGTYSPEGQLLSTFRVCEDHAYANHQDDAFTPDESNPVGVVHPIRLSAELRAQWNEILIDYEITQPFPQIAREIYQLTPEELDAEEIKRFQDTQIPGATLAYTMEKLGWYQGALHDHGDYRLHYKDFVQGNITAIVGDYQSQHVNKARILGSDAIDGCLFLVGQHREPYHYPVPGTWAEQYAEGKRLRLGEVDPLVISEVLRDLTAITTAQRQ
jgi:Domain of unknown function (DUF4132)